MRDDRGQPIRLSVEHRSVNEPDIEPQVRVFRLCREMPWWGWIAVLIPFVALVGLPLFLARSTKGAMLWKDLVQYVAFGAAIIGAFFAARAYRRAALSPLAPASWCRQCNYDLAEIPAEEDGCKVCPECGAAWRAGNHDAG